MISFGEFDDMDAGVKKRVQWKLSRNQCLVCTNKADGDRGLCRKCTNQRKVKLRSVPKEKRAARNNRMVERGFLLAKKPGRKAEVNCKL